jgi:hypothetical protein
MWVPKVSEREGEAFVANFPLATNQFYRNKEGEEVSKTEWHQIVNMSGTFISIYTGVKRIKTAIYGKYQVKLPRISYSPKAFVYVNFQTFIIRFIKGYRS